MPCSVRAQSAGSGVIEGESQGVRRVVSLVLSLGIIGTLALPSGGAPSAAQRCNRESVADLVRAFVRAYNRGDSDRLHFMWADEPDFEWYSVSPDERERDDAYRRETLIPYFAERHRLDDRLRLKRLRVGPEDDRGMFGIAYRLRRMSDQASGRGLYHGKASAKEVTTVPSVDNLSASRCVLFVWSMGRK
jgi:hypothetical protein